MTVRIRIRIRIPRKTGQNTEQSKAQVQKCNFLERAVKLLQSSRGPSVRNEC